ncbi:MAG TPA: hypothetical protein VMY40_03990 [Anaerolineae bacterium]|nr:hypothetical protein [Anaerolineae bacterium]
MIDDYDKTMELMHKMEAQLPIPARPTAAFFRSVQKKGIRVTRDQQLQIKHLVYAGDEGGIMCDVTLSRDAKEALLVSITHLRIDPRHPLAREIRAYQKERTKRLTQSGGLREPHSYTIRPRKRGRG